MPINNITPVNPGLTTMYWVKTLNLSPNLLEAELVPTDGTYIIGNTSLEKTISDNSPEAHIIVNSIFQAIKKISGQPILPHNIHVVANDTMKPIILNATFEPKPRSYLMYMIEDLFVVLQSNAEFAMIYQNVINYLSQLLQPQPYNLHMTETVATFDFEKAKKAGQPVKGVVFRQGSWEIK